MKQKRNMKLASYEFLATVNITRIVFNRKENIFKNSNEAYCVSQQ